MYKQKKWTEYKLLTKVPEMWQDNKEHMQYLR